MYERGAERKLAGVESVIDKDLCSGLLARELAADLFVMLTDADAVYSDWGRPTERPIRRVSAEALAAMPFAAGSMGPKVEAACRFAVATGNRAAIGALQDLSRIIAGEAGTTVYAKATPIEYGA
jgi:carbamate kinase